VVLSGFFGLFIYTYIYVSERRMTPRNPNGSSVLAVIMNKTVFLGLLIFLPLILSGQSHNYWTRSFNEESSLLSGAVVGGGSGPSAIYYNPASIPDLLQIFIECQPVLLRF
jgi:hypothetical protein